MSAQACGWRTGPQHLGSPSRVRETGDSPVSSSAPGRLLAVRTPDLHEQGRAKARPCMLVGCTLKLLVVGQERPGGLKASWEKRIHLTKRKRQPPCSPGAPSGSLEARHSPPPRCLLLFSRNVSVNGYRPQNSTSIDLTCQLQRQERTPGLSPHPAGTARS